MSDGRLAVARLPPLSGGRSPGFSPQTGNRFEGLTGPTYHVHGQPYPLPPPKALKPYVDTKAGYMDTWPAHASGHGVSNKSLMLSKNKSLILLDEDDMGKAQIIPKPRFLEQLEGYLKKELRVLGVTDVVPNELRLQAHREVFEYLVEDFKTYKPLLSVIKNEYEMMLAFQRQQIRELEPLKQMLVTVSEQCDQKIMSIREEEKQDLTEMRSLNKRLGQQIESMRNEQRDLQTQVYKLQEELETEYHKYRDECDARKLLVSDINELRYQQEDMMASKQLESEEAQDDPVTLKIALRQAREDEKNATQRLNDMTANYGDVIPRRDFEALEAKFNQLNETFEIHQQDFLKLKAEHEALLDVNKQVTKQRDEFYLECETLRRSSTPRPDWEKCADHLQGGLVRWKDLAEGKTSNELVDVLLSEIAAGGVADVGGAEYFDGQGAGPAVPKYLRHDGPVQNRRLGKRDCSLLVRDIWREKGAHDAERTDGVRSSMADFLYEYLQRRFALEQMIVEWGYNLHDACQRYSHDEHIGIFWQILNDEVDEEVYHSQVRTFSKLLSSLTTKDVEQGNQGKLTKDDFKEILKTFFNADDETLNNMVKAAETELDIRDSDESLDFEYKNLFMEDDEGRTGPFLDEVRKTIQKERLTYVEEIKAQLVDINPVSVDDLKRAVSMADPEIDNPMMDQYLTWAFQTTSDNLYEVEPVELSDIINRLQNGNIRPPWRRL